MSSPSSIYSSTSTNPKDIEVSPSIKDLEASSPANLSSAADVRTIEDFQSIIENHRQPDLPLWWSLIERFVALIALIVAAPVITVLAILVRLDSPGPALFRQWRVGRNGKLFRFTKFRTYYVDAKQRFPELYAYNYTPEQVDELKFKIPNDPRATRLGHWLRQSTLDEAPNFWNVVTGEMSLVGPRPEIPEMLRYYTDDELRKFSVKPGVTGIAQVSGRGLLTFRETVACDLDYVNRRSVALNIRVVFMTVWRVMLRHGAF